MVRRGRGRERHEEARRSAIEPMVEPGSETTVVGLGVRLEGTLVSAGLVRVEGQVKGKITAEGDVILSSHSQVEADIQSQDVVVGGTFKGNITARGKTELAHGSRVEGNIRSKSLVVADGALFAGQSIMDENLPRGEEAPGVRRGEPATTRAPVRGKLEEALPNAAEAEDREDELAMAHQNAARQAAQWFGSMLPGPGPEGELDQAAAREPASTPEDDGVEGRSRRSKPRPKAKPKSGSPVGSRG